MQFNIVGGPVGTVTIDSQTGNRAACSVVHC
jgi:hypothetical protein